MDDGAERQLEGRLRVTRDVTLPLAEIVIRASRSSGPGGQHANVTASRIEVVFDVRASATLTEAQKLRLIEQLGERITAIAQETRSQARNRELALTRLAERMAQALAVPRTRRPTRRSAGSEQRRLDAKTRRAGRKAERRRPGSED